MGPMGPMGPMGGWMVLWWAFGLAIVVLLVWLMIRAVGGVSNAGGETPEEILKRRYARGEIDREEYQRRLDDVRH